MSRGHGWLQQALMTTFWIAGGKPMSFEDIRAQIRVARDLKPDQKFSVSFERSLRRALQTMVRDMVVMAIGTGGPGDPYHYIIHPIVIGATGDKELKMLASVTAFESTRFLTADNGLF
jgi:hypothetical protein